MAIEYGRLLSSYAEYAAIADDERYEVLEGELIPIGPAPFRRHQNVAGHIFATLYNYARASRVGKAFVAPVDVVLQGERPPTILQPDVAFVLRAHFQRLTPANIQGPPDLVVEVLSPSNARKDAVRKRQLYERFGVMEYWIVPESSDRIEVLRLGTDGAYGKPLLLEPGEVLTCPFLPGFALDVASIFPDDEA